jgi:hypothetical protein
MPRHSAAPFLGWCMLLPAWLSPFGLDGGDSELTLLGKQVTFPNMKSDRPALSVDSAIRIRLEKKGRGWCFTPTAFLDLGSRNAVWMALSRLCQKGVVRRLARGLYDYPRQHPRIGMLSPDPDRIARALSERDASRIQPSGAYAANMLGLSDQVPARIVFLTDGAPRHVRIGRQEIVLKNTTPRNMATAGRISGTVIQALRHVGAGHIGRDQVAHLRRTLPQKDRDQLRRDRPYAPGWMHRVIADVVEGRHA